MFTSRPRRNEGYELVQGRSSSESPNRLVFTSNDGVFSAESTRGKILSVCLSCLRHRFRFGRGSRLRRTVSRFISVTISILLFLIIIIPIFNPSYSRRPSHYLGSNPNQERVFIAANIVDKDLIRGAWGKAVLDLIDIIGIENAFLSVYENDSGSETKEALQELSAKVKCPHSIVSGHIDLQDFPTIQILPNEKRVKRLNYLAAVRNHALDSLSSQDSANATNPLQPTFDMKFDRLLFLNDVVFSPKDAADLLFATNAGPDGIADYQAACAMDFINPIKFYDRFAMRDNEAYRVGVPFYPWFAKGGKSESFQAVMRQSDAVPVKSCWGGMVAFESKWFHKESLKDGLEPLRFRSEPDIFWDASECCLIHADLQELVQQSDSHRTANAKIFANPFIRVAYDPVTHSWLEFTRRFERLYTIPHLFISWLLGMPWYSTRRLDIPGRQVRHLEWIYTGPADDNPQNAESANVEHVARYGHWELMRRTAKPGGFCGYDFLLALKTKWEPGERMWEKILAPPGEHGDSKFT